MSIFYFTTPDNREYELSCTTNVTVNQPAVITKSPVESGKSIIDNYYLDNTTISFSGVITNVTVMGQDANRKRDVDTWISDIETIRRSKDLLVVHYDTNKIVTNCVITRFDISKTKDQGKSGWQCTLVFQEVDISERARLTTVPEAKKEVKDATDPKSKTSSNNKKEVATPLATTVSGDLIAAGVGLFTGGSD